MNTLLVAVFILNSVLYNSESSPTATNRCTSSFACGSARCCRDSKNQVISTHTGNNFHRGFLFTDQKGVCTTQMAQKGEMCDSSCLCDVGLGCYQPPSGTCCAAATCVDEAYAIQQRLYWANCSSNPDCHYPV